MVHTHDGLLFDATFKFLEFLIAEGGGSDAETQVNSTVFLVIFVVCAYYTSKPFISFLLTWGKLRRKGDDFKRMWLL